MARIQIPASRPLEAVAAERPRPDTPLTGTEVRTERATKGIFSILGSFFASIGRTIKNFFTRRSVTATPIPATSDVRVKIHENGVTGCKVRIIRGTRNLGESQEDAKQRLRIEYAQSKIPVPARSPSLLTTRESSPSPRMFAAPPPGYDPLWNIYTED